MTLERSKLPKKMKWQWLYQLSDPYVALLVFLVYMMQKQMKCAGYFPRRQQGICVLVEIYYIDHYHKHSV